MARVVFRDPIRDIHGKVRDLVYSGVNGSGVARPFVIPDNPRTSPQVSIRGIVKTVMSTYSTLNGAQCLAWKQAAANVTRRRVDGSSYTLMPNQFFGAVNMHRVLQGASISTTPPSAFTCPPKPGVTEAHLDGANLLIQYTPVIPVGSRVGFWRCLLTPPTRTSAEKAQISNARFVTDGTSGSYIAVATHGAGSFAITLNDTFEPLFAAASVKQFGLAIQPLSDGYVPTDIAVFFDRVYYDIV